MILCPEKKVKKKSRKFHCKITKRVKEAQKTELDYNIDLVAKFITAHV